MDMYAIHGTIADAEGNPAVRRVVCMRESDGAVEANFQSAADGSFAAYMTDAGARLLLFAGEPARNAQALAGVTPIAAAERLPASFSQSSVYGAIAATTVNMRDQNFATGGATNSESPAWIEADLGAPAKIGAVIVAGGSISGWGGVAFYLNGATLEYHDGATWQPLGVVSGASDAGGFEEAAVIFPDVVAQRFRLRAVGYLATTEFRLYGPPV